MAVPRFLFAFTGERGGLYGKPFSRGEWTYSTDRSLVVRIPRVPEVPEVQGIAQGVEELPWPNFAEAMRFDALPLLPPRKWAPCEECAKFAGGVAARNCGECGGTGRLEIAAPVAYAGGLANAVYLRRMFMFLLDVRHVVGTRAPYVFAFKFAGVEDARRRNLGAALLMPMDLDPEEGGHE